MSEVDWSKAPSDACVWIVDKIKRDMDHTGWYRKEGGFYFPLSNINEGPFSVDSSAIEVFLRPDNWKEGERRMEQIAQNGNDGHYDELENNKSKYHREIKKGVLIDVYDVLNAFEVINPAMQHALKKMLAPGKRGAKGTIQDMKEAIQSIERAIELENDK